MELYTPAERAATLDARLPIFPKLGVTATFVSTLLALLLVPDDPYPAGALFPSALVMTLGLLVAPAASFTKSPRALLRIENLIAVAPVYWLLLDLLQGAYSLTLVSPASVEKAFVAIGLFVCSVWAANFVPAWAPPRVITRAASFAVNERNLFVLILIFFTLGFLRFAYPAGFDPWVMADSLLSPRWSAPWGRGQLGGWDAFLDHLAYFGYVLPTLTVLLGLRNGWLTRKTVVAVLLSLIMLLFLMQGGGRRIIGVVVGTAMICWFLEQRVIRLRQLLVVCAGTLMLVVTMQIMLEYRDSGFGEAFADEGKELRYGHLHVDDNFLRLSQIIELVPESHPYVYENHLAYILLRPIPRVLWEGKPIDPGFDLSNALGERGVSLSSSAVGELYLSFGLIGVFIGGLVYGRLAGMFGVLLLPLPGTSRTLVYSLAAMTLVAGMRSLVEVVLMSYALLAWIVVSRIVLGRTRWAITPPDFERPGRVAHD